MECKIVIRDFERRLAEARSGSENQRFRLVVDFAGVLASCVRRWKPKKSKPGTEPMVGDSDLIQEDLIQDTLLRGAENLGKFSGDSPSALQKWLLAILRNLAIKAGRERMAGRARQAPVAEAETVRAPTPTPLDQLLLTERDERVQTAMDRLSERELMILMLFLVGCPDAVASVLTHAVTVIALRSQRQRIITGIRTDVQGDAA